MLGRRQFLKLGLASAAGIAARPLPAMGSLFNRVKGVIWLWMDGGMSQVHTWDPKPIPTVPKAIDTTVSGIQLSELLPVCASQMHHLSIIRTMQHGEGHGPRAKHLMQTGVPMMQTPEEIPSIGSILAFELGREGFPLPRFLSMGVTDAVPDSSAFGEECRPFFLGRVDNPIPNIRRNVGVEQDQRRAELLQEQNAEWGAQRLQRPVEQLKGAAVGADLIMNTPLLKAFSFHEEPPALREAYGSEFGLRCLVARRLVQAGVPFVEVGLEGWSDTKTGLDPWRFLPPFLDKGLGTLVKDLAEKRMLEEILVVCATECGRKPDAPREDRVVPRSDGFSVVLAGGPLLGGSVYGDTGPKGTMCNPSVSVHDLFATIYAACGVDWEKRYRVNGRVMPYTRRGVPLEHFF